MPNLSYNDERHEYTLDGTVVPSVTQIVQAVTGKDLSGIPAKVLKAARDRGNRIHADVEAGTLETEEGRWIEKQINRDTCQFEKMACAEIDGLTFAGRVDMIDGDLIGDVKSQESPDILGWTIQQNLYRAMADGAVNRLKVYHTPKSGNYHVFDLAILSNRQLKEIADAYREGRVLDESFLVPQVEHEELSLDLVVYEKDVGKLTTNAKAILDGINRKLETYSPENYTEENIANAKRDKADLNNAVKALNDKRIEIEREFNRPLEEFKGTIKEAVDAIKTASSRIDSIVKDVEAKAKEERKNQLKEYFDSLKSEYVTFDQIFKDSWLNKTAKVKEAKGEILAAVEKVEADLAILDRIGEPEARAHYLLTLNLDQALAKADEIKAVQDRLAKIEAAKQEEAPAQAEPVAPVEPVVRSMTPFMAPTQAPAMAPVQASAPTAVAFADDEILAREIRVFGTVEQLTALTKFMHESGIKFQKI